MKLEVNTNSKKYPIILERGVLNHVCDYYSFDGSKVLIITDEGVPSIYLRTLLKQIPNAKSLTLKQGEQTKSIESFSLVHQELLKLEFSRNDILIALGGGVIGDLTGFVASTYKRGIRFINIPTTSLSQIDSSVGGKTGINFNGVKNVDGTFYQPELVLIDFDTLKTLPSRHLFNGLVEALKMGLILSKDLYEIFKKDNYLDYLEEIITQSVILKKEIVEQDEKENNIRAILNFGHTLAHGFESYSYFEGIYHGEAVANGMLYMIEDESLRNEVRGIIHKMNIEILNDFSTLEIMKYIGNDKKVEGQGIKLVLVNKVGKGEIVKCSLEQLKNRIEGERDE